jgi:hypothetical protein
MPNDWAPVREPGLSSLPPGSLAAPSFPPRGPGSNFGLPDVFPVDQAGLVKYAGDGLYRLSDEALRRLRPIFRVVAKDYDLSRIRIRFSVLKLGDASTLGDNISIRRGFWNEQTYNGKLRVLAHEATHSGQFAKLGTRSVLLRRLAETARYGPMGQYAVPDALANLPLDKINIVDRQFTIEALADRVSDFVELPGAVPP